VHKAFKYRFYPNARQEQELRRTFGCVRLVYNRALQTRTTAWYQEQRRINYVQSSALLTDWKQDPDLAFLSEVSSVPLQQGLRHLQTAFTNFFAKRARYPRFKSRLGRQSAEYTRSAFRWRDGELTLAKMAEPLNIVWSRDLPAGVEPTTVTVSCDCAGRWHVSMLCDTETKLLPVTGNVIGVDLGLKSFAVTSDGEVIDHPKLLVNKAARLARYQRRMARKQKGSINRAKARVKVARVHAEITDARQDFLHKTSTRLVATNDVIVVEDLAVANMVRNHSLARSISDSGWAEFRRQLEYKCEWYGRRLVVIDRWYPSSKTCSTCGHLLAHLSLGTRHWTCPGCGTRHDRDLNAAKNILAAGLAVTACGADVRPRRETVRRPALKQEGSFREEGIPRL
jgi:putative transposase